MYINGRFCEKQKNRSFRHKVGVAIRMVMKCGAFATHTLAKRPIPQQQRHETLQRNYAIHPENAEKAMK